MHHSLPQTIGAALPAARSSQGQAAPAARRDGGVAVQAIRCAVACALLTAAAACSTRTPVLPATASSPDATAPATTFVVVRHAEKAADDPKDPALSEQGMGRAAALARRLRDEPLSAVYSTDYRRTRQTVLPSAEANGLSLTLYDARAPAAAFAARLRAAHGVGTVLVVGHSNTVPDIVGELSGRAVPPLPETRFDHIYRVRIGRDGEADLQTETY